MGPADCGEIEHLNRTASMRCRSMHKMPRMEFRQAAALTVGLRRCELSPNLRNLVIGLKMTKGAGMACFQRWRNKLPDCPPSPCAIQQKCLEKMA